MSDCCPESIIDETPCTLIVEDECTAVISYEVGPTGPPGPSWEAAYGSFVSSVDQTAAISTPTAMTLDTTVAASGIAIVGGSAITVTDAGVYDIQFSAQVHHRPGGGSGETLYIWLRRNGTPEPDTATRLTVPNNTYLVPAWDWMLPLAAGDAVEIMWQVDTASIVLEHEHAVGAIPDVPSLIVSVMQVA